MVFINIRYATAFRFSISNYGVNTLPYIFKIMNIILEITGEMISFTFSC